MKSNKCMVDILLRLYEVDSEGKCRLIIEKYTVTYENGKVYKPEEGSVFVCEAVDLVEVFPG